MKKNHQERTSAGWKSTERWAGTSTIYAASGKESVALCGDYDVAYEDIAGKQAKRARAKAVKGLAGRKLRDQLLVIFGPDMSARKAVTTLRALVRTIETEGLDISRTRDGISFRKSPSGDRRLAIFARNGEADHDHNYG